MHEKKVWFNWHCPHCQHRNRVSFAFQFEVPRHYEAIWKCDECLIESKVEFDFMVHGWFRKETKAPKLKKRVKEKKEIKKLRDQLKEDKLCGNIAYKNSKTIYNKKK